MIYRIISNIVSCTSVDTNLYLRGEPVCYASLLSWCDCLSVLESALHVLLYTQQSILAVFALQGWSGANLLPKCVIWSFKIRFQHVALDWMYTLILNHVTGIRTGQIRAHVSLCTHTSLWLHSRTHTFLSTEVPVIAAKTAKALHLAFFRLLTLIMNSWQAVSWLQEQIIFTIKAFFPLIDFSFF